jgi:cysteine desulfurase
VGVYLDWNATAPPLDAVVDAMACAARTAWGNPASVHAEGRRARGEVEKARETVAALTGTDLRDVVLTSGGTEANNLAVRSAFATPPAPLRGRGELVLVTSRLEHPSITKVAEALAREGRAEVRWARVRPDGTVDLEDLARAAAGARLVTVQAVNHETGVLQPVAEVVAIARAAGALVHVDAVQAWGKIPFALATLGVDSASLAGHKLRGPKGIGALVTRPDLPLSPILFGGAQERGVRPGTVDAVAAAGLAVAAADAQKGPARHASLAPKRDALEAVLVRLGGRVAGTAPRAAHVSNVVFAGWQGPELVAALDLEGVRVSSGSACSAGTSEPSPVIQAMLGRDAAGASIRVSIGDTTTDEDVARAAGAFVRVVTRAARV